MKPFRDPNAAVQHDENEMPLYVRIICGIVGWEQRWPHARGYGYPTTMAGVYLSIDHRIPRALGGSSERSNLRVLCTRCNTKKGTKAA